MCNASSLVDLYKQIERKAHGEDNCAQLQERKRYVPP